MTGQSRKLKVKQSYSTKEKTKYNETTTYDEILYDLFMITKQQNTLAKLEHIMQYGNIIGGLDYEPLSKTMSRDAAFANSSKLIDHRQNQHTYPRRLNHYGPLLIVQWI